VKPATGEPRAPDDKRDPVPDEVPLLAEHPISPDLASRLRLLGLNAVVTDEQTGQTYFKELRPARWWRVCQDRRVFSAATGREIDLGGLLCLGRVAHHVHWFGRERHVLVETDPGVFLGELGSWLDGYARPDPCSLTERTAAPFARVAWNNVVTDCPGPKASVEVTPALGFEAAYPLLRLELRFMFRSDRHRPWAEPREQPVRLAMAVLADLNGNNPEAISRSTEFYYVYSDNFNRILKKCQPRLQLRVPDLLAGQGHIAIELRFSCLEDFRPEAVAMQIGPLRSLLETRGKLVNLALTTGLSVDRERSFPVLARKPGGLTALADTLEAWEELSRDRKNAPVDPDVIARVLGGWRLSRSDQDALYLRDELRTFGQWVDSNAQVVPSSSANLIEMAIDALDTRIARQLGPVLQHEDFRALESTVRGLWDLVTLVSQCQGDVWVLKVRVLSVSREELNPVGQGHEGGPSRGTDDRCNSVIRELTEPWEGQWLCTVVAYEFDHSEGDVALLRRLCEVTESAGVPLVAGVSPRLFGVETWEAFDGTDVAERLARQECAGWHELRRSRDHRSLVLALPGYVDRAPYLKRHGVRACFELVEHAAAVGRAWDVRRNAAFIVSAALARAAGQGVIRPELFALAQEGFIDSRRLSAPAEVCADLRAEAAPLGPLAARFSDAVNVALATQGLTSLTSKRVTVLLKPPPASESPGG
jgi:type VI secretion system ImpB/VipA family protein